MYTYTGTHGCFSNEMDPISVGVESRSASCTVVFTGVLILRTTKYQQDKPTASQCI